MTATIKGALCATAACFLGAGAAWADGSYSLYTIGNADPMGEIHIQGDVVIDGDTYAAWWVPGSQMMLFIPPDAAYVEMVAGNPDVGRPFEGGWVSHATPAELGANVCSDTVADDTGTERALWGTLTWTVTSATDYEFEISLGTCDGAEAPWAQNVDAKG